MKPTARRKAGAVYSFKPSRRYTSRLERRVARSCGCLCSLDMEYAARTPNTLRQAHGWAYGVINKSNGNYHVWQAEEIGGKFMLPSDIVEL